MQLDLLDRGREREEGPLAMKREKRGERDTGNSFCVSLCGKKNLIKSCKLDGDFVSQGEGKWDKHILQHSKQRQSEREISWDGEFFTSTFAFRLILTLLFPSWFQFAKRERGCSWREREREREDAVGRRSHRQINADANVNCDYVRLHHAEWEVESWFIAQSGVERQRETHSHKLQLQTQLLTQTHKTLTSLHLSHERLSLSLSLSQLHYCHWHWLNWNAKRGEEEENLLHPALLTNMASALQATSLLTFFTLSLPLFLFLFR